MRVKKWVFALMKSSQASRLTGEAPHVTVLRRPMGKTTAFTTKHIFPHPEEDPIEKPFLFLFAKHTIFVSFLIGFGMMLSGIVLFLFFMHSVFLLFLVPAFFYAAVIPWLYRSPQRIICVGPRILVSPSDGVFIGESKVYEPDYLKCDTLRLSMSRSLFNVQIDRAPCAGRVLFVELQTMNSKRGVDGEYKSRESLVIGLCLGDNGEDDPVQLGEKAQVVIKESASRKIACRLRSGDCVQRGSITGMGNFRSMIEVFIPLDSAYSFHVNVMKGSRVRAGATVLGGWKENNGS